MDALTVAAFEQRAAEAEARLSVLEAKLLAGALACAATVGWCSAQDCFVD